VNWKGLQFFLHVAKVGNISSAAHDLGIVQPALSRHIRRLENELGVNLFVRAPRGVELTPAGQLFLERGRRMMAEYDAALQDLSAMRGDPGGRVTFGILATLAQTFVPRIVRNVQERFPNISLRIIEGSTSGLREALLAGRANAAIMTDLGDEPHLELTPVVSELIAIFAPVGLERPRPFYTLEELVATPIIASAGLHAIVNELIRPRGLRLNVEVEVDSVDAVRRILMLGMGITLQPVNALREDVESGDFMAYPVADASLHRMLALAHPGTEVSPGTRQVLLVAHSEMTKVAAEGLFARVPVRIARSDVG
jgi:LysR family transcriptional regulator, nitrogen assimilation regulatory protein